MIFTLVEVISQCLLFFLVALKTSPGTLLPALVAHTALQNQLASTMKPGLRAAVGHLDQQVVTKSPRFPLPLVVVV